MSDRILLSEAIWRGIDDMLAGLTDRFLISVSFRYRWLLGYRESEFRVSGEGYEIIPKEILVSVEEVRKVALRELNKERGKLVVMPEDLVNSGEFDKVLREVLRGGYKKVNLHIDDVEVEIEGGHKTLANILLDVSLVGNMLGVRPKLSSREFSEIMELVYERAEGWYGE